MPIVLIFLLVAAVVLIAPIVKAYAKRIESHATPDPELMARLNRLEAGIESIAQDIERLSEAQAFTTKLLADRSGKRDTGDADRGAQG